MHSLKQERGEKIHTRNIKIEIYGHDDKSIIVQGELVDERLKPYYNIKGERCQPCILHHMIIRMLIEGEAVTIKKIEAEMDTIPLKECMETISSLEKITGMTISPGFTNQIKEILGGVNGCTHLTSLVISMAPAAVQGYFSYIAEEPLVRKFSPDLIQKYVVNSCQIWKEGGILANMLKEI